MSSSYSIDNLVSELSSQFPRNLLEDLLSSYQKVLVEFRKGSWEGTLLNAGKFVEHVFRLLYYVVHEKVVPEISRLQDVKDEVANLSDERAPESIRLLVPRIALAMIYDPRSKKGAVHVKSVSPNYIDAILSMTACDWILAELIRVYDKESNGSIATIVNSIVARKVPFIEEHQGKSFVTVHLTCEDETLLLLMNAKDGLSRRGIGESLENTYSQPSISIALKALLKKRFVVYPQDTYRITGPGETHITGVLSKIV